MSVTCLNLINNLKKSVEETNDQLIDHMTEPGMRYEWACIKPSVNYDTYYQILKKKWENEVSYFVDQPEKCYSMISKIFSVYDFLKTNDLLYLLESENVERLANIDLEDLALNIVANNIMRGEIADFRFEKNAITTLSNLLEILREHCLCQSLDIFNFILNKYHRKYRIRFQGKNKEEIKNILRYDYQYLKNLLETTQFKSIENQHSRMTNDLTKQLTGLYGFSLESELDRLIPNELGSLKDFFMKVITTYYNNLHPIIWAQIFRKIIDDIFVELPFSPDEIFQFMSKHVLLNSGPFILKILQMIRPILTPELATKYNLTKLRYPVLQPHQIELILNRVVHQWDMYKILLSVSASVGHVVIVHRVDNPADIFVIKIIKPLAIAQSCWEYKILYNVFEEGTCEQIFLKNILESNGHELNVIHEKENMNKGHEYYTANYQEVFGVDIDAKLTAVREKEGVIREDSWFALAMTLAPGVPLSDLIETDSLEHDTKYRAKLHRCLDLLVSKFFYNIVKHGFYHGDLHSGNIFFSYQENQMTLIDFGAVGEINVFSDDLTIHQLLSIIVMSTFYDYDGILDTMTELVNSKCKENLIDTAKPEYETLKQFLCYHHLQNIKNHEKEKKKHEEYKKDIFSEQRINDEKSGIGLEEHIHKEITSIYTWLEYEPKGKEIVVENKDVLPVFTEILGDSESITFPKVLAEIIKFYAQSGVNIAIKFNNFYELQKAYSLLLGVLYKVHYNSYRIGIALEKAFKNWGLLPKIRNINTIKTIYDYYSESKEKFNKLISLIQIDPNYQDYCQS